MQGQVDAIVNDSIIWRYIDKNHPESKATIVPYESENDPGAQQVVLMAKGNTKLIATVNEGIAKLKQEGKFKEIETRWLGDTASPTASTSATTEQAN